MLGLLLIQPLISGQAAAQLDAPPLRLLILRNDTMPAEPTRSDGVDDAAVPALSTPAARAITTAFIGKTIDDTMLTELASRLHDYYTSIGRPFVEIVIPAQDIDDDTLRININEKKLGKIRVEGNRWFDDQQYIRAVHAHHGDPIDTNSLAADNNWLNQDTNRHATFAIGPGDEPNTYDLTIRAEDRVPLDVTVIAGNTGTPDTGLYRIGAGLDWTNAFWRGDDLSYGFLTSSDQFRLLAHALSYTTYLPWRDTLTISGLIADTRGQPITSTSGLSVNGQTSVVSLRYTMSLPGTPAFLPHIDLGYDFKSTNTNILAGGNSVFPATSELDQFVVDYGFRSADRLGSTELTMTLVGSPGHLTPRNTQSALASQQLGASPSYVYGRLSIDRLTKLPFDTAWNAVLTGQYSSDNLLPSEQLVFGGIRSVRGFMELSATRDSGILMQNEFRLAPVKAVVLPGAGDGGTLVPFVFLDFGAGRDHLNLEGFRRSWLEMVSTGPGLTWHVTPTAVLRLSWGFPLIRNGHTGPVLGPQFGVQMTF